MIAEPPTAEFTTVRLEAFFDACSLSTDLDVSVHGSRGVAQWTFGAERTGLSYRGVDLFEFDGDRIALKDAFRKERSQPICS